MRWRFNQLAAARCITFGGMRIDRVLAKEVLDRLQPLGVEAALAAIEARSQQRSEKKGQLELALQQARYEAARAQRQYDVADPDNRLVAGELERRWRERLVAVRDLEFEIDRLDADRAPALTEVERERLMALGQDLARAWESPVATPETRKKIIRTVISEIIVDIIGDTFEVIIHWQGGDHTRLAVNGTAPARRDGPPTRRWLSWCAPWRARCRTRRSLRCSTDPASRLAMRTAGHEGVFVPCAITMTSPSTVTASAPSVARRHSTRRPRPSP